MKNHKKIIQIFLSLNSFLLNGTNPNIQKKWEKHLFILFAKKITKDSLPIIKILLENGTDPNIKNYDEKTPFHFVAIKNNLILK
jgi:ankyrin repeat protein